MKPRTLIAVALSVAVSAVVAASATGLTVTSGSLVVMSAPTPTTTTTVTPSPISLTIANKAGGAAGTPEAGDTISVGFSDPLDLGTVCKDWTGTASLEVAVAITHDDRLTVSRNGCTGSSGFRFAQAFTLGDDYNTATEKNRDLTFNGTVKSKLELSGTSTLRITLGTRCTGNSCGTPTTGISTATATYEAEPGIKTSTGEAVTGSISSTAKHF